MSRNQRSVKNILVYPAFQMRMGVLFLTIASVFHAAMTLLLISLYYSIQNPQESPYLVWWMVGGFTTYIIFIGGAFAIGVWYSHRIVGPLIPIRNFLNKLIDGDYSARVRLREKDELKDLADHLNVLADRLQKTHSKS